MVTIRQHRDMLDLKTMLLLLMLSILPREALCEVAVAGCIGYADAIRKSG